MNATTRCLAALAVSGAVAAAATGAEAPATQPATAPAPGGKPKVVRFKDIEINFEKRQIVLEAQVVLRSGMLELLVCLSGTKEHESILATEARGAHLHAGLLALGLKPGRAARYVGTGSDARFLPPEGPRLNIRVRWKDQQGKVREEDASAWLSPVAKDAAPPTQWVFVGSKTLEGGRYWADVDGDIVSLANFAAAVIDVPFESSNQNADLEFEAKAAAIPPLATPVQVVISPVPGRATSPYATAVLEIGPDGELQVDRKAVAPEALRAWATAYINEHAKGFVLIRADARALVGDVQQAITELWTGGVRDFDVERLRGEDDLLPRTPEQTKRAMALWEHKFRTPREWLTPPDEAAAETLEQIKARINELEARRRILADYQRRLSAVLDEYKRQQADTPKPEAPPEE